MAKEKLTEGIMVRFGEAEELAIRRMAERMDLPAAVLCRRWVRLGMRASSPQSIPDDNEVVSAFGLLGGSET